MNNTEVLVIDDFYENPLRVRETALAMNFDEPPPLDIDQPQNGGAARRVCCPDFVVKEAKEKLEELLRLDMRNYEFQYRLTLGTSIKRAICHIDSCEYTAVMYLTLPEHCRGGTTLFKNIPTNHFRPQAGYEYNYTNANDWQTVHQVEMKFNRMVVYPGRLFHSPTPPFFGDNIHNGRLSQTMFINY